jgi:phage-related protein
LVSHDWSGAWETIRSTLANVMNLILSLVGTNLAEFTATWRSNFENAKLIVTTVFNNIVASIRNRLAEFRQMGRNIIQGLVDGAKSMVGSLVSSVTGAVNDAIGAAKKLLGIQSPSKVFAGIGVQMMAGWQQGIEQDSDMPARATARAAQRTLSAARTTQNLAPAFGGLQLVYAPVFSTADRDELEEKLMPIIEAGWRRMQRRV